MLTRPIYSTIFDSVFSIDNGQLPPFPNRLPDVNHCIGDITINPDLVFKALKPNLAAGPDELPPIFYYNTATNLSYPLALLFRSLIDLKDIPNEWKLSIVAPKFTQGSASNVENYQPIALTCTANKILETIVADFSEHKLISKHQHGFLKKHSTSTNLLESFNDWTLSLNNRHSVQSGYVYKFQTCLWCHTFIQNSCTNCPVTVSVATCWHGYKHFFWTGNSALELTIQNPP